MKKLFIFEPYEWSYCGGAIGVIAESFEGAINLIIEEDKKSSLVERAECRKQFEHYEKMLKNSELETNMRANYEYQRDMNYRRMKDPKVGRTYWPKYFAKTPQKFKKDHYDQWLLTHELEVLEKNPRILFDNWNYS